jgi:hypothetical protein
MPPPSSSSSKLVASAMLVIAIALVTYTALRPLPPPTLTQPLTSVIPDQIPGWVVKDLPIAETEEMKKAVDEILNYDDAVYRNYNQGQTTISVYVAYWKPGKMSPRLIAAHTPDVCWVNNGWKCTARDFAYPISLELGAKSLEPGAKSLELTAKSLELTAKSSQLTAKSSQLTAHNSIQLKPAQAGTYEIGGNVQHVLFWHLHKGELVAYDTGKQPPWYAALADLWRGGFNQRGEQFFIRIASNVPMSEAIKTDALRNALQALDPLGLYAQ